MTLRALAMIGVLGSSATGAARPPRPTDFEPYVAPPPPPQVVAREAGRPWRLEGGVGARFGSQLVDSVSGGVMTAAHLDGGVRQDRLLLIAEYQLGSLELDGAAFAARGAGLRTGNGRGLEHRLGATARYSFGRVAESDGGLDLWGEAGLGVEHYRWDAGGVWTRPDLAIGVGVSMWGQGESKHGGFSTGVRIAIARRDDTANAPVSCGGPCDQATTPTGWDRSVLFDMTVMFGK